MLNISKDIYELKFYPNDARKYLIASNWDIIASEQAFVKRCGECNDEIGSMIICSRIAERLMRLCFLYKKVYAPYSKWFGTAFNNLDIDENIKRSIKSALCANTLEKREDSILEVQALVANLHNESGITDYIDYNIECFYGRNIKAIFADAMTLKLRNTSFENVPLIGSLSQIGGLSAFTDDYKYFRKIKSLYKIH